MQAILKTVVNNLNEIVGKIWKIHILNNNPITFWTFGLVNEVTFMIFCHPSKLIFTFLACSMILFFMLVKSSLFICKKGAIMTGIRMEVLNVLGQLLFCFTNNCTLIARIVMIIFLMSFNIINPVKSVSTFGATNLVCFQMSFNFRFGIKHLRTVFTFLHVVNIM